MHSTIYRDMDELGDKAKYTKLEITLAAFYYIFTKKQLNLLEKRV